MGKTFEYTLTIRFQDGLDSEKVEALSKAVKKAFDNRLGQMIDRSDKLGVHIFEGDEIFYNCLYEGLAIIGTDPEVLPYLSSCSWKDNTDPEESYEVLPSMRKWYDRLLAENEI